MTKMIKLHFVALLIDECFFLFSGKSFQNDFKLIIFRVKANNNLGIFAIELRRLI